MMKACTPFFSKCLYLLTVAVVTICLYSCSDDTGVDGGVIPEIWDIATYAGPLPSGGSSFSMRQVNDSPLITLTYSGVLEDIAPGTRMAIHFIAINGKAYESGPIKLLQASKITQGEVETQWSEDYDDWQRDKVFLYSIWRTGSYINFNVKLTYTTEPRIFKLVADPATLDSDSPVLYLVHILPREIDNHDRTYLASFDISPIWNRDDLKSISVRVANSNLNKDIFTFTK